MDFFIYTHQKAILLHSIFALLFLEIYSKMANLAKKTNGLIPFFCHGTITRKEGRVQMAEQKEQKISLTDVAYQHIKKSILNCEYLPGQAIYEKRMADELDIGRTPVREALIRLEHERLVHIFPRQGMCASQITEQDIMELYQLRKLLDVQVILQYMHVIDREKLLEYQEKFTCCDSLSDPEYYEMDISFHLFLISCANNEHLFRFYRELMQVQYRVALYSLMKKRNHPRQNTTKEHLQIIQAILTADKQKVNQILTRHIDNSLLAALESLGSAKT